LDESEILVFVLSAALAVGGGLLNRTGSLHGLYFRGNPGPGIVRLGVLLAMGWIALVLWRWADPSVTGIYVVFYLVMGYAVVKLFGQSVAAAVGARTRVDVAERRNVPAAVLVAAFTVATGLIFGGSLWGEADPVGDDEGGWWIPVTFFLLGWGSLLLAFAFFLRREGGSFARRIRRERSMTDAWPAAAFLLAAAVALTDAVAGDFWGWRHGLLTFGVLAGLLLIHEAFRGWAEPGEPGGRNRLLETGAYAGLAALVWALNRFLDLFLGAG
jgi:hypothetical protein